MIFDQLPKSSGVALLQIYLKKTQFSSLGTNNVEHQNNFDQRPENLSTKCWKGPMTNDVKKIQPIKVLFDQWQHSLCMLRGTG